MRSPKIWLALVACLLGLGAKATNVQFIFSDCTSLPEPVRSLTLYPYYVNAITPGGVTVPDKIIRVTGTNSSVTVTNLIGGTYQTIFAGVTRLSTNWFTFPDINATLNASATNTDGTPVYMLDAKIFMGSTVPAYNKGEADRRFVQNGVLQAGTNTSFRTNGGKLYVDTQSGGGSGGITTAFTNADIFGARFRVDGSTVSNVDEPSNLPLVQYVGEGLGHPSTMVVNGSSQMDSGSNQILPVLVIEGEHAVDRLLIRDTNSQTTVRVTGDGQMMVSNLVVQSSITGNGAGLTNYGATNLSARTATSTTNFLYASGFTTSKDDNGDPVDMTGCNGVWTNLGFSIFENKYLLNGPNGFGFDGGSITNAAHDGNNAISLSSARDIFGGIFPGIQPSPSDPEVGYLVNNFDQLPITGRFRNGTNYTTGPVSADTGAFLTTGQLPQNQILGYDAITALRTMHLSSTRTIKNRSTGVPSAYVASGSGIVKWIEVQNLGWGFNTLGNVNTLRTNISLLIYINGGLVTNLAQFTNGYGVKAIEVKLCELLGTRYATNAPTSKNSRYLQSQDNAYNQFLWTLPFPYTNGFYIEMRVDTNNSPLKPFINVGFEPSPTPTFPFCDWFLYSSNYTAHWTVNTNVVVAQWTNGPGQLAGMMGSWAAGTNAPQFLESSWISVLDGNTISLASGGEDIALNGFYFASGGQMGSFLDFGTTTMQGAGFPNPTSPIRADWYRWFGEYNSVQWTNSVSIQYGNEAVIFDPVEARITTFYYGKGP